MQRDHKLEIENIIKERCQELNLEYEDSDVVMEECNQPKKASEAAELERMLDEVRNRQQANQAEIQSRMTTRSSTARK